MRKRTWLDWFMLGVVVFVAGMVIVTSFQNTKIVAKELNANPFLVATVVEIIFATLLFIRGKQRAIQLNVPTFIEISYFVSLAFVTGVNVYGLSKESPVVGSIVGIAISGAMWLMESTLVWLWVDSHKPHKKSVSDLKRKARAEIEEMQAIQLIDYMKYNAQKPDLDLIKKARKDDEKRKRVVGEGLPEYFLLEPEPTPIVVAEPITVDVDAQETKSAEIVPLRTIGFHIEETKPAPRFEANVKAQKQAVQTAKDLQKELGRLPKQKELVDKGISRHYASLAIQALKAE